MERESMGRATGVGGETAAWIYAKENVIVTGYRSGVVSPGCHRGTRVAGQRPRAEISGTGTGNQLFECTTDGMRSDCGLASTHFRPTDCNPRRMCAAAVRQMRAPRTEKGRGRCGTRFVIKSLDNWHVAGYSLRGVTTTWNL